MVVQAGLCCRTMAALFGRRHAAGYEPIGRQEDDDDEYDEAALFEEDLGQALEERGDRFMARGTGGSNSNDLRKFVPFGRRRRLLAIARDFREAALSYVLARNWRKAAPAYNNQAVYALKGGSPLDCLDAASALLNSGRCYTKISHKDEGDVAAAKLALLKAFALFVKEGELPSAYTCCVELAEFCVEQEEWQNALYLFDKAKYYYGSSTPTIGNLHYARYCYVRALLIKPILLIQAGTPSGAANQSSSGA